MKERNTELVALRDGNPKVYSFGKLALKYGIRKETAFEIYHREKAKKSKKARLPASLGPKYKKLAVRSNPQDRA